MGAHAAGGIYHTGAVLDRQPFNRIGVVAGPGLRHVVQDARIEPAAAAGAAFEQHMREGGGDFFHHPVQSQHIAVGGFPLALRRQGSGTDLRHMAVHVPFDIGNRS
ncbi:hypothetical protein D3C85_1616250 [compost metagenome]